MPTQNTPCGGQSPAKTKPSPQLPSQPVSGTWFQEEHPQILIQWMLNPPSGGNPDYTAEVGIYQMIFDTKFPVPHLTGSTIPFSVMNPSNETTPYLQGSLVLSQPSSKGHHNEPGPCHPPIGQGMHPASKEDHGPILKVLNLQFPGFKRLELPLYPSSTLEVRGREPRHSAYPQMAAEEDLGD